MDQGESPARDRNEILERLLRDAIPIASAALSRVGLPHQGAEDLLQKILLQMFGKAENVDLIVAFLQERGLVRCKLRLMAIDELRREQRHSQRRVDAVDGILDTVVDPRTELVEGLTLPERTAERRAARVRMARAIRKLPPRPHWARLVIYLKIRTRFRSQIQDRLMAEGNELTRGKAEGQIDKAYAMLRMAYEGGDPRDRWPEEYEDAEAQAAAARATARPQPKGPGRPGQKLEGAIKLLGAKLSTGPRLAQELYDVAASAGIAERTLRRAAAEMGVVRSRRGGGKPSIWRLPASWPACPGRGGEVGP